MRTVISSIMTSLDGMFDGPGDPAQRLDWMRADQQWLDYSIESLDAADTLVFGWRTFDGMSQYWPTATGPVADRMNGLDKIGFSSTARHTTWNRARVSIDPVGDIAALKQGYGGNILILGSAGLVDTLTQHGLIDEYRIAINPVALGAGTPMFPPGRPRLEFERTDTRSFDSGIVELRLRPTDH